MSISGNSAIGQRILKSYRKKSILGGRSKAAAISSLPDEPFASWP